MVRTQECNEDPKPINTPPIIPALSPIQLPSTQLIDTKTPFVKGQTEILCNYNNVPVYYHDGEGYFYVLNLYRCHVR